MEEKQSVFYAACAYASGAPLPAEFIDHIILDQQKRFSLSEGLSLPSPSFHELRHQIYLKVKEAAEQEKLTTTWLARELTELTPQKVKVRRQTLSLWKQANIVKYDEEDRPEFHSVAALLLARQYSPLLREWRPTLLAKNAPWYAWIEVEPGKEPLMCAFPYEEEIPATSTNAQLLRLLSPKAIMLGNKVSLPDPVAVPSSALLYTPWEGATLEKGWYRVKGGAARFLGKVTEEDLARWNEHVKPFGITEEDAPDIFETAKLLVLQILAETRLKREREAVIWRKE